MNISLTPHLEELVKAKIESGLYNSASEVMRDALRLAELKRDIQKGIDSGEPTPLDIQEIKARGRQRLAAEQGSK